MILGVTFTLFHPPLQWLMTWSCPVPQSRHHVVYHCPRGGNSAKLSASGVLSGLLAIAALPFCKKSGLSCPSCVCPTVLKFAWQKSSAMWKSITKHYPPISSWVSPSSSMNLAFYAYNCWPTTYLFPAQWESRFKHMIAMWKPYGLMEITLLSSSG